MAGIIFPTRAVLPGTGRVDMLVSVAPRLGRLTLDNGHILEVSRAPPFEMFLIGKGDILRASTMPVIGRLVLEKIHILGASAVPVIGRYIGWRRETLWCLQERKQLEGTNLEQI